MSWLLWILLVWTLWYVYLFELEFSPDICLGVVLQNHMITVFLVFWGTSVLFSIVVISIYFPTNSVGWSLFSIPFPAFAIGRPFNDGHSDFCEVVLQCNLFASLIANDVDHLYMCPVAMSYLEKCIFRFSAHILIELLVCCCYWVIWTVCIFRKLSNCQLHYLQTFGLSP